MEETGLRLGELSLVGIFSDPRRDRRRHTISIAGRDILYVEAHRYSWGSCFPSLYYRGSVSGAVLNPEDAKAGDDAKQLSRLPLGKVWGQNWGFDHLEIIRTYLNVSQQPNQARPFIG